MKHNWEYKRFGDVLLPKKQISRASLKFGRDDSIDYIDISSIDRDNKCIIDTAKYIFREAPSRAQQCVEKEDVLLSLVRPNLKNIAIVNDNRTSLVASSGFCVLRSEQLLQRYIFHLVTSERFTNALISKCSGATYPAVNDSDVRDVIVPVPSLDRQKRIVAELDALNGTIAKCRELITTLDSLAQSLFYDTFGDPITNPKGWPLHQLKYAMVEMFLGPFGSALKTDCYVPEEKSYAMVYEQKHAIRKTLYQENHFIDEEKFNSLKRFEVLPGDFLMSCRGTIGQLYQVPSNSPRGIIHPSVMKIRLKSEIYSPKYFNFFLPLIIANESTKGNCVQMAITAKELGRKVLPVPPLALQEAFAARIEAIEAEKKKVEATMAEVQTLLDSRMDYWFN